MLTGNYKSHSDHIYCSKDLELLKVAALYGANGSGKSNLLNALRFLKDLVAGKHNILVNSKQDKFKLSEEYQKKDSVFELEIELEGEVYFYKVSINNSRIVDESLYKTDLAKDILIFSRKYDKKKNKNTVKLSDKYTRSEKDKVYVDVLSDLLTSKELFLSFSKARERYKEIRIVYEWIRKRLVVIFPTYKQNGLTKIYYESKQDKNRLNELIRALDTGIYSLDLETIPVNREEIADPGILNAIDEVEFDNEKIVTVMLSNSTDGIVLMEENEVIIKTLIANHQNEKGELIAFDLKQESDGTQRLIDLIPLAIILSEKCTILIDEIDRSIHPYLIKGFINKIVNHSNLTGQLIFSTHESNLLDLKIFRQDEIWFVEKDKFHSTQLYPLSDYNPRYDLDIRKGYLNGRFGAIPFLANLDAINWNDNLAEKETANECK